jgi:hypothetical protein
MELLAYSLFERKNCDEIQKQFKNFEQFLGTPSLPLGFNEADSILFATHLLYAHMSSLQFCDFALLAPGELIKMSSTKVLDDKRIDIQFPSWGQISVKGKGPLVNYQAYWSQHSFSEPLYSEDILSLQKKWAQRYRQVLIGVTRWGKPQGDGHNE